MAKAEFHVQGVEPVVTTFVCGDCNAEDHDNGCNPPVPQFLNCWNCGAGYGLTPQEMHLRNKGMFPKIEVEQVN